MLCNSSRTWWSFFFKLIVITGIFSIFFTRFTTQIEAKEYSINSLLIEAIIRPDGSMEVTEKRLYDFRDDFAFAYQYLYHHPDQALAPHRSEPYEIRIKSICDELKCYAFLPYDQVDIDNRRNNPAGTFTVLQETQKTYFQWHFKAIFEQKTFTLNYVVDNAITLHEDTAELYWQFIGDEWEVSHSNILITVILPEGIDGEQISAWMHEVQGGVINIVDDRTVTFQLVNNPIGRFTETRIIFPKEVMSGGAAGSASRALIIDQENEFIRRTERANQWQNVLILIWLALIIWAWVVALREVYRFVRHDIQRIPPANLANRFWEPPSDLEPALVEQLLSGSKEITARAFTATALSLVQQKAMRIIRSDEKKGLFVKDYEYGFEQTKKQKNLTEVQQSVFDYIFKTIGRNEKVVWFTELIKYSKKHNITAYNFIKKLGRTALASNVKQGMFDDKKASRFLTTLKPLGRPLLVGICLFAISSMLLAFNRYFEVSSLILSITLGLPFQIFIPGITLLIIGTVRDMPHRTVKGLEEASLWKAFKKHMQDYQQTKKYPIDSIILWEKYLVYGALFGVSAKTLSQLPIQFSSEEFQKTAGYWGVHSFDSIGSATAQTASLGQALGSVSSALSSLSSSTSKSFGASGSGSSGGSSGGGRGSGGEKTANWPTPTPSPGVGFNRRTNWPVVKTRAKKAGID